MIKQLLKTTIIACCSISIQLGCCELPVIKFPPEVQKNASITKARRNKEYTTSRILLTTLPAEENNNISCFQYAFKQATGFKGTIGLAAIDCTPAINTYFDQTENPEAGDLVIYTANSASREAKHYAIAINSYTCKSKWGDAPQIWEHGLFDIPESYGNAAWFYTLKAKYKTVQGKQQLIEDIANDLAKK